MATQAQYIKTVKVGSGIVSSPDFSRILPSEFTQIYVAGENGARIERISLFPTSNSTQGTVRIFKKSLSNFTLVTEVAISTSSLSPVTGQGNVITLDAVSTPNLFPLLLNPNQEIVATISSPQIPLLATVNSLATTQTLATNALVSLNGVYGQVGSLVALAAAQSPNSTFFALNQTTVNFPARLSFTSAGNSSNTTLSIVGLDVSGNIISESLAGPNTTTILSDKAYKTVLSVHSLVTPTTAISIGYASSSQLPFGTKIIISSSNDISGVLFTIRGLDVDGKTPITETLQGDTAGKYAVSTNRYWNILSIIPNNPATNIQVGNDTGRGGIQIEATGGDY